MKLAPTHNHGTVVEDKRPLVLKLWFKIFIQSSHSSRELQKRTNSWLNDWWLPNVYLSDSGIACSHRFSTKSERCTAFARKYPDISFSARGGEVCAATTNPAHIIVREVSRLTIRSFLLVKVVKETVVQSLLLQHFVPEIYWQTIDIVFNSDATNPQPD